MEGSVMEGNEENAWFISFKIRLFSTYRKPRDWLDDLEIKVELEL